MLRLQKYIYTSTPTYALVAWILNKLSHNSTSLIQDDMKHSINSVFASRWTDEVLDQSYTNGCFADMETEYKSNTYNSKADNVTPFSGERNVLK